MLENVYKYVWEKVVEILDKDSNIVYVFGENIVMFVVSKLKKMFYYVEIFKSGKIECLCDGYKVK